MHVHVHVILEWIAECVPNLFPGMVYCVAVEYTSIRRYNTKSGKRLVCAREPVLGELSVHWGG